MKYYYLINTLQWSKMDKLQVSYKLTSLDGTQILVITSQMCENYLFKFESAKKFMLHSYYTTDEWCDDGSGIQQWEIDTIEYIAEIDEN